MNNIIINTKWQEIVYFIAKYVVVWYNITEVVRVSDKKFYYLHERQLRNYLTDNLEEILGLKYIDREIRFAKSQPDIIGTDGKDLFLIEIKNIATYLVFDQLLRHKNTDLTRERGILRYSYIEKYNNFKVMLVAPIIDDETMIFCNENDIIVKVLHDVVYCGRHIEYVRKSKVLDEYMWIKANMNNDEVNQLACLLNSGAMMF